MIDRDNAEKKLNERRKFEETRLQNTLKGLVNVLVQFSYIRKGELTYKAKKLSDIFDTNALMVTEMIEGNYLERLQPEDIAEIFSWFAYDRDIDFLNSLLLPRYLVNLRRELDDLQNAIFAAERRNNVNLTRGYNPYFFGAARAWCKGTSIADLLDQVDISEGDLVMTFNKTLDLMRQVRDMFVHHDPAERAAGADRGSGQDGAARGGADGVHAGVWAWGARKMPAVQQDEVTNRGQTLSTEFDYYSVGVHHSSCPSQEDQYALPCLKLPRDITKIPPFALHKIHPRLGRSLIQGRATTQSVEGLFALVCGSLGSPENK